MTLFQVYLRPFPGRNLIGHVWSTRADSESKSNEFLGGSLGWLEPWFGVGLKLGRLEPCPNQMFSATLSFD